ncbi:galactose-binding domain-containing protein [Stylonychia lemnae]|uniref:Galactose-binding domain-containing protein n=1 Tax=Stylonychia lemnae TaxID=5949 RepID=A0A078AMU3_STYLE|nr:galactose-binding domain-containing protein [Stylonychia lemnae]|eukprot:CDW83241.1 galactose-binding domain-containing protein [Stylonychia lemnae]
MDPTLTQGNPNADAVQNSDTQLTSKYNFNPQVMKVAAVASGFPVSASSEHDPGHSVHRCIINVNNAREGATTWCAGANDTQQWIQVCLITPKLVTSVALQGRGQGCDQWVTRYRIMYSIDGINWKYHEQGQEYVGSMDSTTVVEQEFKEPFFARTVRIVPTQWHGHISTSFEVYFME